MLQDRLRARALEAGVTLVDPGSVWFSWDTEIEADVHIEPGVVFGPGVRVDSHIYSGYAVPPYYDSLIGKLITHGENRDTALARMATALDELVIEGIKTNTPLHRRLVRDAAFKAGGTVKEGNSGAACRKIALQGQEEDGETGG